MIGRWSDPPSSSLSTDHEHLFDQVRPASVMSGVLPFPVALLCLVGDPSFRISRSFAKAHSRVDSPRASSGWSRSQTGLCALKSPHIKLVDEMGIIDGSYSMT